MSNFDLSNIVILSKFQLNLKRRQILIWSLILSGLMFMYMILFPQLQDLAQVKMDALPKEMLQLMGSDSLSDLGVYNSYFKMVYAIILIAISIFISTFTSSLIVNEEKEHTIEFVYAQQVSKEEIFISKVIVSILSLLILMSSISVVVISCGYIVGGDTFDLKEIVKIISLSLMIPLIYFSVSILLSGVSSKIGLPSVSAMFVIVTYMFGYLGTLLEDKGELLRNLSPFELYSYESGLSNINLKVMIGVSLIVVMTILGLRFYKKRDLNL